MGGFTTSLSAHAGVCRARPGWLSRSFTGGLKHPLCWLVQQAVEPGQARMICVQCLPCLSSALQMQAPHAQYNKV
ncbi:hypothetical protein DL98DRAFT_511976, partial [Cadophora sp. DSE1049]